MINVTKLFDLKGKTALVTDGDKGIGYCIALGLAEAGADIMVVSASVEPLGGQIGQAVQALGRNFKAHQVDLHDRNKLYRFIMDLTVRKKCRIDILINHSGMINKKPLARHPDEYWDRVMKFNLDTPFILARELGKRMAEHGSGKIIFTSPSAGFRGNLNGPGQAASRGALVNMIRDLAHEWSGQGINVNGIFPGYILGDRTKASLNEAEKNNSLLELIPAGRWGDPDDFKGPAVFLSSAAADYVNGTILAVDGGWLGR
ncbi:SDR family oxidoreductase [Mucilaginibacter sp. SMC90]|nr:SDR family oxidoreductase [Mucilaginibacter sp. SMC90]